ncbi:NDP-hexose 2,3-dehydratase family protein [Actinocrispum wychmicini]|uniref:Oxidase EvaA n=1 Tax=Actinocrispum wychmicini TaxID=1213861 RepID=A0A4R2IPU6_9PSEU|nr:NDP-hexose 2,3-dehydratase family protein [Actinocrispum wychmicini]TCO44755.1 oxidase EvaA [Actinocrispum wychmicini]
MPDANSAGLLRHVDRGLPARIADSVQAKDGGVMSTAAFYDWLDDRRRDQLQTVDRIPFSAMRGWGFDPATGDLRHHTGRFFSVQGLHVRTDFGPVGEWYQPIINQPEIGILGIAVREIDGLLHCLMQAKVEPGNINGVQLSPTVQATKSNYTRVHQGNAVPYLEHFRSTPPHRVLADVLQSEQGSWFYGKRNRNMIIEVDSAEAGEDFCWLTIGQLHELLRVENLVNMDARTVLSCMPDGTDMGRGSLTTNVEMLSWITARQAEQDIRTELVPLPDIKSWFRTETEIRHELGVFFSVVGVDVTTNSREVSTWAQPLIEPHGVGIAALLIKRVDGVLHALVNARVEPGYRDVVEIAPTVQCTVENYAHLPAGSTPPFLEDVLSARPERVLFDTELSEEGGRFYHARSRYLIIEVDADFSGEDRPDYRWLTLPQLTALLQHSHYLNVQARTSVACLRGLL